MPWEMQIKMKRFHFITSVEVMKTLDELYTVLTGTHLPVAYGFFEEGEGVSLPCQDVADELNGQLHLFD